MSGFHDGELAVQERAGVRTEASRLSGMVSPGSLSGGAGLFLSRQRLAMITARDAVGRLWISPLAAREGFLDGTDTTLSIHNAPGAGDPLHNLPDGQPVGMVAIDFAARRRLRINGQLTTAGLVGLEVDVDQAFGNCPQYIHRRELIDPSVASSTGSVAGDRLTTDQASLVEGADTFFLGTIHPRRGADASHRGGPAGFVRVEGDSLWWPDYPGNNMFNSFGNLEVDDEAALLFIDFTTGETVQLSGRALIEWAGAGAEWDEGGTGRRVRFRIERVVGAIDERLRAHELSGQR